MENERIVLTNLPYPPTDNHAYPTIRIKDKKTGAITMRRITGKDLKLFKNEMTAWYLQRLKTMHVVSKQLKNIVKDNKTILVIEAIFHLAHSDIWTLKGELKKNDVSNRIKPLHDGLAGIISVDDKHFFPGLKEKTYTVGLRKRCVTVIIKSQKIRTLKEALAARNLDLRVGSS